MIGRDKYPEIYDMAEIFLKAGDYPSRCETCGRPLSQPCESEDKERVHE